MTSTLDPPVRTVDFRPSEDRPRPWPITDYGIIGNLETVALVSPTASIDWACLPHFSSPSVFARLLDPDRGGFQEVVPLHPARCDQQYIAGTNVLRTRFHLTGRRVLSVVDFLPVAAESRDAAPPMIVRVVSAKGGPVRIRVTTDARLGYGQDPTEWERSDDGGWATGWSGHLALRAPGVWEHRGSVAHAVGIVSPRTPWTIELSWGGRRAGMPPAPTLLEQTIAYWQGWVRRGARPLSRLPRPWRRWVLRSELTLKLLSQRRSGAFVAAATTSIPEWPRGPRNWDYRYAWFRDAAFSAQALLLLGHVEEAERFLRWVVGRLDATRESGGELRILYDAHGERIPIERTLGHLAGYLRSAPVRVGNGAERQFQLDVYGELLAAAGVLAHLNEGVVEGYWPELRRLALEVVRRWKEPDQGIWEARGPPQHYVHSKAMAWVALNRAGELARRFEGAGAARPFEEEAATVHATVLRRGYDAGRQAFVQAFDRPEPDAANLRLALVRFVPFDDPKFASTVRYLDRHLTIGPFVSRFRTAGDPLGPEGTFLACSFWRVECRARMGEREGALADWTELLRAAGPLRLFSEEFDPRSRRALGNYPQALTHIGLLRSAFALASTSDSDPRHERTHRVLDYRPPASAARTL